MKKSHLFILGVGFTLGLLALSWAHAQTPSSNIKASTPTTRTHSLFWDQHEAFVAHLKATGQTNAIEMFREYQCAYSADSTSSELRYVVGALQAIREGRTNEAIQVLEQRLGQLDNMMCNSYGGLSATNRQRVDLEPVEKTLAYYAKFPPAQQRAEIGILEKIVKSRSESGR